MKEVGLRTKRPVTLTRKEWDSLLPGDTIRKPGRPTRKIQSISRTTRNPEKVSMVKVKKLSPSWTASDYTFLQYEDVKYSYRTVFLKSRDLQNVRIVIY